MRYGVNLLRVGVAMALCGGARDVRDNQISFSSKRVMGSSVSLMAGGKEEEEKEERGEVKGELSRDR